jgi:hypothetical protein
MRISQNGLWGNEVKFLCSVCGSKKYKLIKWDLRIGAGHLGVYCFNCGKWHKFLSVGEEVEGIFCCFEEKKQRKRRKSTKQAVKTDISNDFQ